MARRRRSGSATKRTGYQAGGTAQSLDSLDWLRNTAPLNKLATRVGEEGPSSENIEDRRGETALQNRPFTNALSRFSDSARDARREARDFFLGPPSAGSLEAQGGYNDIPGYQEGGAVDETPPEDPGQYVRDVLDHARAKHGIGQENVGYQPPPADIEGYYHGRDALPPDQLDAHLQRIQATNPDLSESGVNLKAVSDPNLSIEDRAGVLAGLRNRYNSLNYHAQGALGNGKIEAGIKFAERAHNYVPDGRDVTYSLTDDGNVQVGVRPTADRGKASSYTLTPQQFHDFQVGNGTDFDGLLDNGLEKHLQIASRQGGTPRARSYQGGGEVLSDETPYEVVPGERYASGYGARAYPPARSSGGRGGGGEDDEARARVEGVGYRGAESQGDLDRAEAAGYAAERDRAQAEISDSRKSAPVGRIGGVNVYSDDPYYQRAQAETARRDAERAAGQVQSAFPIQPPGTRPVASEDLQVTGGTMYVPENVAPGTKQVVMYKADGTPVEMTMPSYWDPAKIRYENRTGSRSGAALFVNPPSGVEPVAVGTSGIERKVTGGPEFEGARPWTPTYGRGTAGLPPPSENVSPEARAARMFPSTSQAEQRPAATIKLQEAENKAAAVGQATENAILTSYDRQQAAYLKRLNAGEADAESYKPSPELTARRDAIINRGLQQQTPAATSSKIITVNSPAEAARLPKGTRFQTPDGKIRIVP